MAMQRLRGGDRHPALARAPAACRAGVRIHQRSSAPGLPPSRDRLRKINADALAWHLIRSEHVSALRGRLQRLYAPATANRYLTALRAALKEAWRLELIDREIMERAL